MSLQKFMTGMSATTISRRVARFPTTQSARSHFSGRVITSSLSYLSFWSHFFASSPLQSLNRLNGSREMAIFPSVDPPPPLSSQPRGPRRPMQAHAGPYRSPPLFLLHKRLIKNVKRDTALGQHKVMKEKRMEGKRHHIICTYKRFFFFQGGN